MKNQNSNLKDLQQVKTVNFNKADISVFQYNDQLYISGPDIEKALGYTKAGTVAQIYLRNQKEFDSEMSIAISQSQNNQENSDYLNLRYTENSPVAQIEQLKKNSKNLKYKTRYYNRRGAYLIAMLSKTKNAADFRKWVLDVLEGKETIEKSSAVGHKPLVIEDFKVGEALKVEGETERQKIRRMMLANCLKLKIFRHNCQSFKEELYKISSSLTSILILIDNFQEHTDIMEKDLDEVWKKL